MARQVPEIHDLVVTFANSIGMVPFSWQRNERLCDELAVDALDDGRVALIANDVSSAEDVDKTGMICLKSLGPCAMMNIVGLEAMYHVAAY